MASVWQAYGYRAVTPPAEGHFLTLEMCEISA